MQKIIVIPDSFKGSLSALEFCAIAQEVITRHFPACRVVTIPVADGGEGSVDCFITALGGEKRCVTVQGAEGQARPACWGLLPDGTAVAEMAAAAGLTASPTPASVLSGHTYGVGQLLLAALDAGCRKLILGLGGSATTDGGCGAAAALGIKFYDQCGQAFIPAGGTLLNIAAIDASGRDPRLDAAQLTIMCDVDNPLFGPRGAAYVFAPQKGADAATVELLDQGLRHLSAVLKRDVGVDVSALAGGGAAGGMGAGVAALLGGELKPGIEVVLSAVDFARVAQDADLVLTGEGSLDSQSLSGKVVVGVARAARKLGLPVVALAGALQPGYEAAYSQGLSAAFAVNPRPMDLSEALALSRENLAQTIDNLCRLWAAQQK